MRQEVKEEPVEDKKYSRRRFGQSTEYNNERPKHRTYVKEEKLKVERVMAVIIGEM